MKAEFCLINLASLDLRSIVQYQVIPVLNVAVYVKLVADVIVIVLVWLFRPVWVRVSVGDPYILHDGEQGLGQEV